MKKADVVAAILLAAASAAWGAVSLRSGFDGPYDEGVHVTAAWRLLDGEIPYRDFWYLHTPGTPIVLAGAFRLFGTTLAVERGLKTAAVAVSVLLVYFLARRVATIGLASATALLFLVGPAGTLSLRPRDLGVLGALAAARVALGPRDSGSRRLRAAACGLLVGLTACFKQDIGFWIFVAVAIVLGSAAVQESRRHGWFRALLQDALLPLSAGAAAIPALVAVWLASAAALSALVAQAVVFPVSEFTRVRSLPVSLRFSQLAAAIRGGLPGRAIVEVSRIPLLFALFATACIGAALRGGRTLFRRPEEPGARAGFLFGLAGLLLLDVARHRADAGHLLPAFPFALLSAASLVGPRPENWKRLSVAAGGLCLVLVATMSLPAVAGRLRVSGEAAVETGLPAAPALRGFDADLLRSARTAAERTDPGERIYVGNSRHDAVGYGATLVYFLAGRKGATRYDNLHPGVVTTLSVQREIVDALERGGTRVVVLWDGPPLTEPNESSKSSGVTLLDSWIAARFREVARFGAYRVLAREAAPAPDPNSPASPSSSVRGDQPQAAANGR